MIYSLLNFYSQYKFDGLMLLLICFKVGCGSQHFFLVLKLESSKFVGIMLEL